MVVVTRGTRGRDGANLIAVDGHAEYDDTGRDIVCSAISMLCCALEKALKTTPGIEGLRVEKKPGRFFVDAPSDQTHPDIRGMFAVIDVGFELLADKYPDHVRIY